MAETKPVRINEDTHKSLKVLAAKEGLSLSDMIQKLISSYESNK